MTIRGGVGRRGRGPRGAAFGALGRQRQEAAPTTKPPTTTAHADNDGADEEGASAAQPVVMMDAPKGTDNNTEDSDSDDDAKLTIVTFSLHWRDIHWISLPSRSMQVAEEGYRRAGTHVDRVAEGRRRDECEVSRADATVTAMHRLSCASPHLSVSL